MKIIKINFLTIYFLLLLFLCGYLKIGIIIFSIVIIHELGHVFFIKMFKYEIIDITIYPFGGMTRIKKDINTPINKELFIAFGGILFQMILLGITMFLPISIITKTIFWKYNLSIMIFNMLPIIPLDGSIILKDFEYGNFYIIEKIAPEGYEVNPDKIYFSIDENGEVVKINMKDKKIEVETEIIDVPECIHIALTLLESIELDIVAVLEVGCDIDEGTSLEHKIGSLRRREDVYACGTCYRHWKHIYLIPRQKVEPETADRHRSG